MEGICWTGQMCVLYAMVPNLVGMLFCATHVKQKHISIVLDLNCLFLQKVTGTVKPVLW